jgi:hypothetical protein
MLLLTPLLPGGGDDDMRLVLCRPGEKDVLVARACSRNRFSSTDIPAVLPKLSFAGAVSWTPELCRWLARSNTLFFNADRSFCYCLKTKKR